MVKKYYKKLIKDCLEAFIENRKELGYSLEDAINNDGERDYSLLDIYENVKKESKFGKKHMQIIYNYACYRVKVERFNDIAVKPNGKRIEDFPEEKKDLVDVIREYESVWKTWGDWRKGTKECYSRLLKNPKDENCLKDMFTLSLNYLYNIIGNKPHLNNKWYPVIHEVPK